MRKLIATVVLLFVTALSVYAQDIKKVAVWETVCRDNSLKSIQKTMVRGGMEAAVGNTAGYEVYDRSAFDVIMKEHSFERSGAVSEMEIKEMGKMAGVQYIIIPEAMVDENDFYIIVKMLDVETGKFGGVHQTLCTSSGADVYKACEKLGAELFGSYTGSGSTSTNQNAVTTSSSPNSKVPVGYTDLGLPSGTKWGNVNANGFYTFDEAVLQFGNRLPSKEQWEELKEKCQWMWTGSGYKVTGPNGNSIILPAAGFCNCDERDNVRVGTHGRYWSSTPIWRLNFYKGGSEMYESFRCLGNSVRLVQD